MPKSKKEGPELPPEEETEVDLSLEETGTEEGAKVAQDIPVKLQAVLGSKEMALKDLLQWRVGQTVDLERPPNEFVDLVANGKLVAKGELVEIDGKLGVRIIKMVK